MVAGTRRVYRDNVDADSLKTAARARPFRPFKVRMADGRDFDIPHPDFISLPPNAPRGRVFVVYTGGGARMHLLDLDALLVTGLEVDTSATPVADLPPPVDPPPTTL